ncbi:MAG: glycosyltransferase family 39 protein [Clostridiales bacterium]|nr:glycosyltransferase family 39 protein [Clostridiales bacterium]
MKKLQQFLQRPYLYIFITCIGIGLKFYHLDSRYFWIDEVYTIQHTSGISANEYIDLIPINEVKNISFYDDLLHLNTQNLIISSQLKGLAISPSLTPGHYVFLIFWHRIVGDDYLSYRLFSLFCFLLTLLFLFLLSKTLFQSDLSAWIIISLFAVSPFFHIYVQEARYYMLWVCIITLLNYIFFQAMKFNKAKWWVAYSTLGILALYISIFSCFIIFGHLIYIFILKKNLRFIFSVNLIIISLFYLPWIFSIIHYHEEISNSLSWQFGWKDHQQFWEPLAWQLFGFTHIFVSLEDHLWANWAIVEGNAKPDLIITLIISVFILLLIIISTVYLLRKSSKETSYFLALIFLPMLLAFWISDFVRDAYLSYTWKYELPDFIVIILIVGFFIAGKIYTGKNIFAGIYIALVIVAVISIFNITNHRCWSAFKEECQERIDAAQLFSNDAKPLLITDLSNWQGINGFYGLITQCESQNIDILRASPDIENVEELIEDKDYSDLYVMYASAELMENLKGQFKEKMDSLVIDGMPSLWKININD